MIHLPKYDHSTELLEDLFVHNLPHPPIVVVDWKVYCHDVHREFPQIEAAARGDSKKLQDLLTAFWAFKLHRGPEMINLEEFCMVVVDDCKQELTEFSEASGSGAGYWRHIEAHKLGLGEYKGGRESKPSSFSLVESTGYSYLSKLGVPVLSKPLFEADDLAGEIVRIKRSADPNSLLGQRLLVLSTVDNDWSGLVSDEHLVIWANTGPWLPRLRSEVEVCDYFFRKEGLKLERAQECYAFKAQYGDVSDNLPAGTPVRLFDLYNADEEWRFTPEESEAITSLLHSLEINSRADHKNRAEKFILSHGILPPGHPKPTPSEKSDFFAKAKETRVKKSLTALKGLRSKKVCEQLLDDPERLEKCVKLALEVKHTAKRIELLSEKLAKLRLAKAPKEEIKKLSMQKKSETSTKAALKAQLESLVPPESK